MSAKLVRSGGTLRAIGLRAGTMLQIIEGFVQKYAEVLHVEHPDRASGAEGFVVLLRFEEPPTGAGVFRVREDGTLQVLASNYGI